MPPTTNSPADATGVLAPLVGAPPLRQALHTLLCANAQLALDARGTTNHLPMVLTALAAMGASEQRLQAAFDHWQTTYALPGLAPLPGITRHNWAQQQGHYEAFSGLHACFHSWMEEAGVAPVLNTVLAAVPVAPASLAFHALIRLQYGLWAGHTGEAAAGLAALVCAGFSVPGAQGGSAPANVPTGLRALSQALHGAEFAGSPIMGRLRSVAQDARFMAQLRPPPVSADLCQELAQAAAQLYWQTQDFTALHLVTALHAAQALQPRLTPGNQQRLLLELWPAFCCAYVAVGAPGLVDVQVPKLSPDWPQWQQLACASDDDHVIKMTFSCHQLYSASGQTLYAAMAARLLGIKMP